MQDDFKSKLCEVAGLRADNEKFKSCIAQMEQDKRAAEDKVRELEVEIKELSGKVLIIISETSHAYYISLL